MRGGKIKNAGRGGARANAGRKAKYSEPTTTITFRVPESFVPELREYVRVRMDDFKHQI